MSDGLGARTIGTGLALLSLLPLAVYAVAQGTAGAYMAISAVSVLLIAGSLYLMFSPTDEAADGDHARA